MNAHRHLRTLSLVVAALSISFGACTKKEETSSTVTTAPSATAAPVRRADNDMPPPPVEEVDAGAEPVKTGPGVAAAPVDLCSRKCTGTTTPELDSTLAGVARRARACYDMALKNDPTIKGHVSIKVRIASNGSVCSTSVGSNDFSDASIANCSAAKFRTTYPAPKGGCVDATIPLNFTTR